MKTISAILISSLFVVGCGKKNEGAQGGAGTGSAAPAAGTGTASAAPAAGTGSAAPAAGTGTAAPAPAPGSGAVAAPAGSLSCDEVLPPAVREAHFAGLTINEEKPADGNRGVNCMGVGGGAVTVVTIYCPSWDEATFKATMEAGKKGLENAADVPGVGRMAYTGTMAKMSLLQFWDDDTPCYGTANLKGDPVPLGKALAAAITPAALEN